MGLDDTGLLTPVLTDEECAAAAFRALLAEADKFGPTQVWDVQTWDDDLSTHTRRLYAGSESALRRAFPDWNERARMDAAGIEGHVDLLKLPPDSACFETAETPFRIRRICYGNPTA
jgi:hypothetical protein